MVPVIRRFYNTKEEISAALKRHMVFYNTNPWLGAIIPGVLTSMEEERASGQPVDEGVIEGVKVAIMGPFAGMGDALFWATYIPIILAIAAAWALSGKPILMWLSPIMVLVVLGLSNLFIDTLEYTEQYDRIVAQAQARQLVGGAGSGSLLPERSRSHLVLVAREGGLCPPRPDPA